MTPRQKTKRSTRGARSLSPKRTSTAMPPLKTPPVKTLFSADQIAARVAALGAALASSHAARAPLILGTLTGAFMFTADLVRAMVPMPHGLSVDFLRATSYEGTGSTGKVVLEGAGPPSASAASPLRTKVAITGRHVILVEDIVDTGRTLIALKAALDNAGAASVTVVSLLDKPSGRVGGGGVGADLVGFTLVDDEFVVGYGLDWDEAWRGLAFVGVVEGG